MDVPDQTHCVASRDIHCVIAVEVFRAIIRSLFVSLSLVYLIFYIYFCFCRLFDSFQYRSSSWHAGWGMANDYISINPNGNAANYGDFLKPNTTLGVLLDMDKGSVSFISFGQRKLTRQVLYSFPQGALFVKFNSSSGGC